MESRSTYSSFQELVTGLVQAGLLAEEEANKTEREGTRQGAESLKQAKAFRTIMRETVERLAARRPVPQATLDAVNQLLRHRIGYLQIGRRGGRRIRADLSRGVRRVRSAARIVG